MLKLNLENKIKFTIKKNYFLESVFVFYLLMMGLLSGYFSRDALWFGGLLFFIVLLLINKSKYRQELLESLFFNPCFYAVFALGCLSIIFGSGNQYLVSNLIRWLKPLIVLLSIIILDSNSKYDFRSALKSYFYLLNFFWIVNLIIVSIQCTGNGFMIKQEWLASNWYYPDHCAGLFGANSTPKLSLFTVFMSIYNLDFAKEISSSYRRKCMYIYIFVTDMWMLYISTLNDNKTLFVLLPVYLLAYYIIHATNETIVKNFYKFAKSAPVILLIAFALIIIINHIATMTSFIQDYVIESVARLVTFGNVGTTGSIERVTIATDAIKAGYGLLLGKGLGAASVSEYLSGDYLGYKHFGMSSLGNMTTLGGIWFYLSVCLFYTHFFYRFIKLQKKSFARWLICLLITIGLTMYTTIFFTFICMLWTCLTFVVIGSKDDVLPNKG